MSAGEMKPVKNRILLVDDDFINRSILQNIFANEYSFAEAENGREALSIIDACADTLCAILMDVNMPEMNGIELLQALHDRGITESIPTFLITANDEMDVARAAYDLGVMDVISKPVVSFIIQRRVQSVIELFQARESLSETVVGQKKQLQENADTIDELHRGTIEALASAIEFRDMESGEHTNRIYSITKCILANTEMGAGLTPEDIENIAIGSIMHDLGKIAISDVILNKPGRLTPEEFEIMKTHTVKGAELMERLSQLQSHPSYAYACDIARHHHERWDGKGYPDGLAGDEISVWSQVVSVADVYDALVSPRVYKKPVSHDQAVEMITGGQCGMYNPRLIACFLQVAPKIRRLYEPDTSHEELAQLMTDAKRGSQDRYFAHTADQPRPQGRQETSDTLMLVSAIMSSFDMIIFSNLTRNSYYMMSYERFLTHCADSDGVFDDLIEQGALSVPESHRQSFIDHFSRDALLKAHAQGRDLVALEHPQFADDGSLHMVKTTVVLQEETRSGDLIDLTFARYIDQKWEKQEKLQKDISSLRQLVEQTGAAKGVDLSEVVQALNALAKNAIQDEGVNHGLH